MVTCRGGSSAARLAAEVARELEALGVADAVAEGAGAGATIAVDGCASACGRRRAAAEGARLVGAVNLAELALPEGAEAVGLAALAERAAAVLRRGAVPARPARRRRGAPARTSPGGQAHSLEDYLVAIDALGSPVVECGALITGAPTLAAHVSDALGLSRAAAGEMLGKLEAGGLVRRGPDRELVLTAAGREAADRGVRRQRVLEVFAVQYLGYGLPECRACAWTLRASFDEEATDRLERVLGSPARCPHGWPIDPAAAREESLAVRALASVAPGERARVARLAETDPEPLRRLAEAGIAPGTEVEVADGAPGGGVRLVLGAVALVLEERAARAIFVDAPAPAA